MRRHHLSAATSRARAARSRRACPLPSACAGSAGPRASAARAESRGAPPRRRRSPPPWRRRPSRRARSPPRPRSRRPRGRGRRRPPAARSRRRRRRGFRRRPPRRRARELRPEGELRHVESVSAPSRSMSHHRPLRHSGCTPQCAAIDSACMQVAARACAPMRMHRWPKAWRAAAAPDHRDVSRRARERQHEQARRVHDGAAVARARHHSSSMRSRPELRRLARPAGGRHEREAEVEVARQRVGARVGSLRPGEQREQREGPHLRRRFSTADTALRRSTRAALHSTVAQAACLSLAAVPSCAPSLTS